MAMRSGCPMVFLLRWFRGRLGGYGCGYGRDCTSCVQVVVFARREDLACLQADRGNGVDECRGLIHCRCRLRVAVADLNLVSDAGGVWRQLGIALELAGCELRCLQDGDVSEHPSSLDLVFSQEAVRD